MTAPQPLASFSAPHAPSEANADPGPKAAPVPQIVRHISGSMFQMDESLRSLLDTVEITEEGSLERLQCEQEIQAYFEALTEKVDSVASAIHWMEANAQTAKTERDFFQKRQQYWERQGARLESYAIRVLAQQPVPKKGPRRLHGERYTLELGTSEVVHIADERAVDDAYKGATLDMPVATWRRIERETPLLAAQASVRISVKPAECKRALKAGVDVLGADLRDSHTLRVK
jgi:hypothetical protein